MNEPAQNEPVLRSPSVILIIFFGLIGFHAFRVWGLSSPVDNQLLLALAFFPAFLGEQIYDVYRLVTYSSLHSGWSHVLLNMFVFLAFGTPVAIRLGGVRRFLVFYFLCVVLAGLAHYVTHSASGYPVIGASGGVAGLVGGAVRFALPNTGYRQWLSPAQARKKQPLLSLSQTLQRGPVLFFVLAWLGVNVIFGLIGISLDGRPVNIAWEAHMGGFLAGLLLFGLFVRPGISPSGGPGNVDYGDWAGSRKETAKE